jgi:hypothetical protein
MSTFIVPRTCTQVAEATGQEPPGSRPLAEFRGSDAYVLLGDPGSGKTTSFYREAEAEGGQYVTARDLITFEDRPEWHDRTLFIDGLDEVRAGQSDGRTPLDAIRHKLNQLGRPRFRLSCREADWLGAGDQAALKRVAPGGQVAPLHLDPLDEEAVEEILRQHPSVPDAAGFLRAAKDRGLDELLRNPQTLNLLVEAVRGDAWPATRQETYDLAFRRLVKEHNREHSDAARAAPDPPVDSLLDTAGFLCAVHLIAGQTEFSLNSTEAAPGYLVPANLPDAPPFCEAVLKTKLFAARGGAERLEPVHRSVAEYLAARHLAAKAKSQGFPMGRVLALITGTDGAPVAALRGLFAWLAVFSPQDRGGDIYDYSPTLLDDADQPDIADSA